MYVIVYMLLAAAPIPCGKAKIAVTVTAEAGAGAKTKWPKTLAWSVVEADDRFAKVESSKGTGYLRLDEVKKACGPQVLKDVTLAYAPDEPKPAEPTAPLNVAKPVEIPASVPVVVEAPKPPKPKPAAAREEGKTKIAVLDLKGSDSVPKELRESVAAVIPESLDGLGPFKAISKQDIEQMLALEAMKESVGCNDVTCLAEIGGALGADYMVTGSLIRVDQTYMLQLQLLNIRTSRPEQRLTREYSGSPQGLFDEARVAVKMLVRELLNARSGTLDLRVSEEGATVRVDGSIVGNSPLGKLALAGGLHTLTVEREGFVRASRDVNIKENEEAKVELTMLPSLEYKRGYLREAKIYRGLAWGFSLLGLGSAVGGVVIMILDTFTAKTLRDDITTYNNADVQSQDDNTALTRRKTSLETLDGVAIGMMAFGVVSLGVGITLFATGNNPSKYDTDTSVDLQLGPGRVGARIRF